MSLSLSAASVPVLARALRNLSAVLAKGEEDAKARNIDPAIFLAARLAPDMFPLTRQVQIATDVAKATVARIAGVDIPAFPDTETSFAELRDRIARVVAFIEGVDAAAIDAGHDRAITLKAGERELSFTGYTFLFFFGLPNVFFHAATAYDILRHNGVKLGKADFLGA